MRKGYGQGESFESEAGRLRDAARKLLVAAQYVEPHLNEYVSWHHKHAGGCSVEMDEALVLIRAAIAEATGKDAA